MNCCTLLVALSLSMGYGDLPDHATGHFSTPMFLRGQPVWVTPVSRRQLRLRHSEDAQKEEAPLPSVDVAVLV